MREEPSSSVVQVILTEVSAGVEATLEIAGAVISAKLAERLTLLVTLVFVLGLVVELSLQLIKLYPVLGTAVTADPLPPYDTIWVELPLSEPFAPAE